MKELEDCGRVKEGLDAELAETRAALARVEEALALRAQEVSECVVRVCQCCAMTMDYPVLLFNVM